MFDTRLVRLRRSKANNDEAIKHSDEDKEEAQLDYNVYFQGVVWLYLCRPVTGCDTACGSMK